MSLTAAQTTFRRVQTDDPATVTVYFSVDATDALGRVTAGPMEPVTLALTEVEAGHAAAIIARARDAYVAQVNASVQGA